MKKKFMLSELNVKYNLLSPEQRIRELYNDFSEVLFTSSFGATSAFLLHLFTTVRPEQQVHFLDTTYHFPETLEYKEVLTRLFNLKVVDLKGDELRNKFTGKDHTWEKDPDLCCSINKVEPLEKIKPGFEIWVSGLMRSQNQHRKELTVFEQREGIIKFYPIIDQSEEQVIAYLKKNNIPEHPLKNKGFHSIGCTHCTSQGKAREGRWINKSKSECGLHS
jgi:phosphoadenosine phosphosulfate reductase